MCSALARACARISAAPQGGDLLLRRPTIHWVVVTHPTEFVRATSTAKIAARTLCGGATRDTCEWLLFGCKAHTHRLDELLTGNEGAVHILFPQRTLRRRRDIGCGSVCRVLCSLRVEGQGRARGQAVGSDRAGRVVGVRGGPSRRDTASCRSARCWSSTVIASRPHSQLIDALHHGSGCGRISTLEACAQLIERQEIANERAVSLTQWRLLCSTSSIRTSWRTMVQQLRLSTSESTSQIMGGGLRSARPR